MKNTILIFFSFLALPSYSQRWEKMTLNIAPRLVHSMALVDNKIFLFGGRTSGNTSDELWSFEENTLKSLASDFKVEGNTLYSDRNGNLSSFGGWNGDEMYGSISQYRNGSWIQLDKSIPPRWGHAGIYYDEHLWVFGGKGDKGFLNDLWRWDGNEWHLLESDNYPSPRYGATMGVYDGMLVLFGGRDHSGNWFTDTWIYKNGWKELKLEEKPKVSVGHSMITTPHGIYLVGGRLKANLYSEMWVFKNMKWTLFQPSTPIEMDFPASCYSRTSDTLMISGIAKDGFTCWKYSFR